MPIPALRALQTTTTTGTGTLTLLAAAAPARGFQAAFGSSARVVRYALSNATSYELGIGTFDGGSPGTLTRSTILASSNAGSVVSLPAGTTNVFAWLDATDRVLLESTGTSVTLTLADLGNLLLWTGTSVGTVALPALATVPPGAGFDIANAGNAVLTLNPNGSETVDGAVTMDLLPGDRVTVLAAAVGWFLTQTLPEAVHLQTQVAGPSAYMDFLLPSGVRSFRISGTRLLPSQDGASLYLLTSTNGGASYANGSSDYIFGISENTGATTGRFVSDLTNGFFLSGILSNSSLYSSDFSGHFSVGSATNRASYFGIAQYHDDANGVQAVRNISGRRAADGTVNAIRVIFSIGNIQEGRVSLCALRL